MKSKKSFVRCYVFTAVFLGIMLVLGSTHRSVFACEPTPDIPGFTPPTPIPIETQVAGVSQDAQIVLDGTVKTWVHGPDMNSILTVEVERYLKGHGPKTVRVVGYFWICAPNFAFEEGSRAIFFADGDPASTEPLLVRAWFDSQEDVVAGVRDSTGEEPRAPDGTYNVLWLSLLITLALGSILFARYRRTRS